MFGSGGHDVDARGVDAAVAEQIGKLGDVLLYLIKSPGKELPQIVRKHLVRIYVCLCAKPLHGCPDVAAVQRLAGSGSEDAPASDPGAVRVLQQELLQSLRDQNAPHFALARDRNFAAPDGLHRKILQL